MNTKNRKKVIILVMLLIIFIISIFLSVGLGAIKVSPKEIIRALIDKNGTVNYRIIWNIRLPRTIISVLVGISLSLSGTIIQGVMQNSLASPSIIGVSSGAGFAALTILILFPEYYNLVPLGAFVGAFVVTMLIYGLAWKDGLVPNRLILAGVAVNSLLGAGNNALLTFFPDRVSGVINFMVGSLNGVTWANVHSILPYVIVGIVIALTLSDKLNILVLGDEVATGLGVNVEKIRFIFIILSSVLAGSAVSVVGLLGFVGLIAPHISRLIIGSDYRFLFPTAILLGAIIVLLCDLISRVLFAPMEIPVGIIMSVLGAPFFLYLLRSKEAKQ
ncbi:FecCD family ABC transporter permease [Clostridium algidicarnis]|uniref:FecCD family ABC transporter permease n=1 Tax=Clostridium algidicarnis TaxID=37659 RepID=UPI001C0E51E2|nr:iron ABC transporter permease [Clostridium algidicarnis]MBU3204014.1 iron ABC transporter permease [Clostridium algidicarnis]MBU3212168.1 iron ABC transporter permease [Clostridium algidicarnis]MBU3221327.1 iron ABC transporter permease [Clostridium algidicarnis]